MHKLFLTSLLLSGGALAHAQSSSPSVAVASTRVIEGNTGRVSALFQVTLSSPSNDPVELRYSTKNGSAKAGEDYVATSGTLTIPAKVTKGTFTVPVNGDSQIEEDETFSVDVTSPAYSSLSPAAYGIIVNDDRTAPTPQPLGKIVFTSARDGSRDIFVMNGDGTHQTNLTNSPDEGEDHAQWSPDGRRIAFVSTSVKGSRINVMNADGSNRFIVPLPPNSYNLGPRWSPNGQKLAFVSTVNPASDSSDYEIYITPASPNGTAVNISREPRRGDFLPEWSPDGKQIVWDSSSSYQHSRVVVAPSDGSSRPRVLTGDTWVYAQPRWSPNGRKIAYNVRPNGSNYDEIYLMNADGSSQINLTRTPNSSESHLEWSRDSSRFTFQIWANGKGSIVATNAIGEKRQQLSKDTPTPNYPQWDPYNSRVAFAAATSSKRWEIYSVEATASSNGEKPSQKLTDDAEAYEGLDWAVGSVPAPTLGATGVSLSEGNSGQKNAKFQITLSTAPQKDLRVTFSTIGITAKPVEDYIAKNGTFVIPAKTRTASVSIPIVGDTEFEGDETFGLRLSAPGYTSTNPSALCTIQNDDIKPTPQPTFTPTPAPTPSTLGKIAYVSVPSGQNGGQIYIMNADGTKQTRLTRDNDDNYSPSLSADGRKIVFSSVKVGNSIDLYSMNADGSSLVQLTRTHAAELTPKYSPDGRKIVYVSNRERILQIYVMNADGTGQTRLTSDGISKGSPVFSPDGSKIAFVKDTRDNSRRYLLYIMNADGTQQTRLTEGGYYDAAPVFSHDGKSIYFQSDRSPGGQLFRINVDGTNIQQVTREGDNAEPTLSPNDRAIAVTRIGAPGSKNNIFAINANGRGEKRLTTSGGYAPSWSIGSVASPTPTPLPTATPAPTATPLPTATPIPTVAPPTKISGKIAYVSYPESGRGGEIFVMNADGSNQTRLTNNSTDDYSPALSADGQKIAYAGADANNSHIYVMSADGTGVTQVTSGTAGDSTPSFSPDGSKIVYSSYSGTSSELFVMNADGTEQTRLTNNEIRESYPVFSPDGSKIAFNGALSNGFEDTSLYIMNADGSGLVRLTSEPNFDDVHPVFSPDGKTLVFSSYRGGFSGSRLFRINTDGTNIRQVVTSDWADLPSLSPDGGAVAFRGIPRSGGSGEIYVVRTDGSGERRLTTTGGLMPSWSIGSVPGVPAPSTSGKITFTVVGSGSGSGQIYVMNADGSNQTRLSQNGDDDGQPKFSADGSKIVFASTRDGNFEIYSMNADGSNQTRLTTNSGYDNIPAFSPDGSKIAFTSNRDGHPEIYLMDADGSKQTRLTYDETFNTTPVFSPDGSKILFDSLGPGGVGLRVINLDGTGRSLVAQDGNNPAYSPDGSKIAYDYGANGTSRIYVINADGSGLTQLAKADSQDYHPSYSPDSSAIAFSSNREGTSNRDSDIYTMNADGTRVTRLTKLNAFEPSWAPGSVPSNTSPNLAAPKRSASPSASSAGHA